MKLLYLASSLGVSLKQSGGAGTHMRGTIAGFQAHGIEVLPVIGGDEIASGGVQQTENNKPPAVSGTGLRGFVKKLIPTKLRLLIRDLRTIYHSYLIERLTIHKIRAFKPDAIYERSGYLSTYGNRLAKKLRIPLYLETDGCMIEVISDNYGVFSKRIGNYIEAKKLQRADCVVVYNVSSIELIKAKFNLSDNSFVIKPLGINNQAAVVDSGNVTRLRDSLAVHGKLVVGFVGMISQYHGISYLLEAAKYLKSRNDIVFVVVGGGKDLDQMRKTVVDNQLNVILTGSVNKELVGNYYKLFDIGIVPDAVENIYPVKVLEYGLYKVCPLIPDYDVFHEIITEGETGFYFKPKDAKSIAEKLKEVVGMKSRIELFGHNWYLKVTNHFTWEQSVTQVVSAFRKG